MSGLLYFIPGPKAFVRDGRLNHQALPPSIAACLADVHEVPGQCVAVDVTSGPDGQPGTVLYAVPTHGELPAALGYFPDRQTWRRLADTGAFLGWINDSPPAAVDLERRDQVSGYLVTDGHGQKWAIPAIRSPENPRGNLPFEVVFDDSDRPRCTVAGPHRKLWEDSATLWDWALTRGQPDREGLLILGQGFTDTEDQFLLDCAFRGLAVNYRVDRHAIAALSAIQGGWLTQVFLSLVVNALIDMRAKRCWEDAQKKTVIRSAAAGVNSTPGEPAAGPISCPPEGN